MKPVAILINGLLMYQPGIITPLAPLAGMLEAAGWEVCIDNHFNTNCHHPKPDLIIGHSQGGATALSLAARLRPPMVITFDAVRMGACPSGTRCINFKTPMYWNVPGATNIPVIAEHASMVYLPDLKQRTLAYAATARNDARTPDNLQRNEAPVAANPSRARPASMAPRPLRERLHSDPREQERADANPTILGIVGQSVIDERWPDREFATFDLTIEQQCEAISFPNPEVCP